MNQLEEQTLNQAGFENDLQQFLNNFDQESEYLADIKPPFKTTTTQSPVNTKSLLNSLLITPSLKKAYSNNLVGILPTKENTFTYDNNYTTRSRSHTPVKLDKLNERTNMILDEQERYKETLMKKFSEKVSNLDQTKQQTKTSIDSLRSNLNEIELLTANNIFKITSIKNCHI